MFALYLTNPISEKPDLPVQLNEKRAISIDSTSSFPGFVRPILSIEPILLIDNTGFLGN